MKDISEAQRQCRLFIDMMENNRPNCDDAGVARHVLKQLDLHGKINSTTRERLFRWCDTQGTLYQRGVPIAREICRALYGKVFGRGETPPAV